MSNTEWCKLHVDLFSDASLSKVKIGIFVCFFDQVILTARDLLQDQRVKQDRTYAGV